MLQLFLFVSWTRVNANLFYAHLGGAGSSAVSSSTTALSLSPRLSNLSRASQGGESLVLVLLSANLLCNCRITLCCRRIIDSRWLRLASISFCFLQSLDSNSRSCDDNVRSCSAFSRVSRATRSSCETSFGDIQRSIDQFPILIHTCNKLRLFIRAVN